MSLGSLTVNNENQYQSEPDEVERRFVFIGKTSVSKLHNKVTSLNSGSDIGSIFTEDVAAASATSKSSKTTKATKAVKTSSIDTESYAYRDLAAAQVNAGQNWTAAFVGLPEDGVWSDALDIAMKLKRYEAVVICDPVETTEDLEAVSTKMALVQSKKAQYMFAMTRTKAIDNTPDPAEPDGSETGQDWATYINSLKELVDGFVSERVMCIPTLFENDLGILAGRLCDRTVTVADSPMRTKTGTLLGMGSESTDKTGAVMPDTIFSDLDALNFSVPQTYPGEDGWYWADGNTFDLQTGDYKLIENLRVVLKACRQVYAIAIPTIADRSLNSSPQSTEKHKSIYRAPLRKMAKAVQINGVPFPGEIYPPGVNSIEITWVGTSKVMIYITVRPYNSPKGITIGIGIDLSVTTE